MFPKQRQKALIFGFIFQKGLSTKVWYFKLAYVPKFDISKGLTFQSLVFQKGVSDQVWDKSNAKSDPKSDRKSVRSQDREIELEIEIESTHKIEKAF